MRYELLALYTGEIMLQQLDENLWIHDEDAAIAGFHIGARMTVIRLQSGALWLHSPLDISPQLKNEIDALGEVGFVASPFERHYLGLKSCHAAYPNAQFFAPPGLDVKKFPDISFTGRLSETPPTAWREELDQTLIRGNALDNEVVFFHKPSRTLICADLCFNLPASRPSFTRFLAKRFGVYEHFAPSLGFKLLTRNGTLLRQSIRRILQWDFDRVIISHGDILKSGGKEKMRVSFAWLRV